ncbi:hypothetical protein C0J52_19418 [Blattella germanica]|nr:hypothetical protein C0J52_19418 [Blattella germanica]
MKINKQFIEKMKEDNIGSTGPLPVRDIIYSHIKKSHDHTGQFQSSYVIQVHKNLSQKSNRTDWNENVLDIHQERQSSGNNGFKLELSGSRGKPRNTWNTTVIEEITKEGKILKEKHIGFVRKKEAMDAVSGNGDNIIVIKGSKSEKSKISIEHLRQHRFIKKRLVERLYCSGIQDELKYVPSIVQALYYCFPTSIHTISQDLLNRKYESKALHFTLLVHVKHVPRRLANERSGYNDVKLDDSSLPLRTYLGFGISVDQLVVIQKELQTCVQDIDKTKKLYFDEEHSAHDVRDKEEK